MKRSEKLKIIYENIWSGKNVWDEHRWDFRIKKVYIWDIMQRMNDNKIDPQRTHWYYVEWYTSMWDYDEDNLIELFVEKNLTINDQTDKCVDFVFTLIEWVNT